MAQLWPRGTQRRLDASNKTIRLALKPEGFVASAWPKKRGLPKDAYQKSILARFHKLMMSQRQMLPVEYGPLKKALEDWNRKNRGNMGAASVRLMDLMTQIQSGRAFGMLMPGGREVYHVDALVDFTRNLDWLRPRAGGILVRTSTGWSTTNNCLAGRKFRLFDESYQGNSCPIAD